MATATQLFVACENGKQVLCLDFADSQISKISMPLPASGLALSADHVTLFVTCAGPESKVCVVDARRLKIIRTFPAGHTAMAPVLSPDGRTLYVCDQFDDDVTVIPMRSSEFGMRSGPNSGRAMLGAPRELYRIPVRREPVAADITRDGRFLLVANELPSGRADVETVAAVVSVIDTAARKVVQEIELPNGSGSLKDLRVSPDGRYAAVTHIVSSFSRATSKVQFGWMNANALTLIDLAKMKVAFSVLLDEPMRGAANPWGVAWSEDGKLLAVAHSGTDEVSLIDFPTLLHEGLASPRDRGKVGTRVLTYISHYEGMDPGLPFLTGARVRVKLPVGDLGPRSLVFVGSTLYVANYFSDTVSVIETAVGHDVRSASPGAPSIARPARQDVGDSASSLGPEPPFGGYDVRSASDVNSGSPSQRLTSLTTNGGSGRAMLGAPGADEASPSPRLLTSSPTNGTLTPRRARRDAPYQQLPSDPRLLMSSPTRLESIPLGKRTQMDTVRLGDYYFHDGNLCLQGWQSCASCHPDDARVDGFNWDLLNDGIGNPKSTRSLLLSFETPPAMFLGVRTNAATAVRAGLKAILFTNAPESVAGAIDAYLKSLKPVPSPHLVHGRLSASARRGAKIFQGVGCADCHIPGRFIDLKSHDVGTRRSFDRPGDLFYTPTLVEVWRTAPYLHDGSAATIRDVLARRNPANEHGVTKDLSEQELNDLCEYVLSL